MRNAVIGALATVVLILGCDEPEPPTEPIVDENAAEEDERPPSETIEPTAPAPSEESSVEATTEERAEAPPLPEATPDTVHVFVVQEDGYLGVDEQEQVLDTSENVVRELSDEVTVSFPSIPHPNPRLAGLINERVEAFAMQDASGEGGLESRVECDAPLATPNLLSLVCAKTVYDDREYADPRAPRVLHLAVDDTGVRPIELASLFLPDADIPGRARAACLEEAPEAVCASERLPPGIALGVYGVRAYYAHDFNPVEVTLEYTELAGQLRATGPLAESFDRYRVRTRAISVTPSTAAPTTPEGPARWVATPMMSATDLAAAWGSLSAADRARVRAQGSYLVAENRADATAVAAKLGHSALEAPAGPQTLALTLVRLARDSDVLAAPSRDADVVGRVARGTVAVALAPLDESVARFPRVVVHRGLTGFVDVRRLSSEDVCAPDLEPFLAGFPEAERASRRTATLRSALSSGSWGRADFLSERGGTTTVELRRLGGGCQVDRSLLRFAQPGPVTQLQTTRTARREGETLVVSSGPERLLVHTFGHPEAVWEHALTDGDEVRVGQRDGDRWIPIVIAHEGRSPIEVEWNEGALTVATDGTTAAD